MSLQTPLRSGPSLEAHIARRRYVTFRGVIAGHQHKAADHRGLVVKPIGKLSAGNRHARFGERGWETERWPLCPKLPRPSSTLPWLPITGASASTEAIGWTS